MLSIHACSHRHTHMHTPRRLHVLTLKDSEHQLGNKTFKNNIKKTLLKNASDEVVGCAFFLI